MTFSLSTEDKKLGLFVKHNNLKYNIRFLDNPRYVNEPTNPNYLRKFEEAISLLERTGKNFTKFTVTATCGPINEIESEIVIDFTLADNGLNNWAMPEDLIVPIPISAIKEGPPTGKVGLLINCRIRLLT